MEGVPYFPEIDASDEDVESKPEKKDKKKKPESLREILEEKLNQKETPKTEKAEDEQAKKEPEESTDQLDNHEAEITADETQLAYVATVHQKQQELDGQMPTAETPPEEAAETLADVAYLDAVEDHILTGEPLDEKTLDELLEQTIEDLDIDVPDGSEPTETSMLLSEADPEQTQEQADETTPPSSTTPLAVPPLTPTPGVPVTGGGGGLPHTPDTMPIPIINSETTDRPVIESRRATSGYFFLGGVIGYMLGRRRGRIKTEASMKPVQEKLEKQVEDLADQITVREKKIRELARQNVKDMPGKIVNIVNNLEKRSERSEMKKQEKHARNFHQPETQPSRLGRLAMEKLEPAKPEAPAKPSIEVLNEQELLSIADRILVEQTSVKKMYMAGRLELSDVRAIVAEYLRGDDFEKLVRHHLRPERVDNSFVAGAVGQQQTAQNPGANPVPDMPTPGQFDTAPIDQKPSATRRPASLPFKVAAVSGTMILVVFLAIMAGLWLLNTL